MRVLRSFFKISETYIGIAAAIAFQLIFFTVWMTAYDGVTERTGNLKVAIVNEDVQIGKTITEQLKAALPFQVEEQTRSRRRSRGWTSESGIWLCIFLPILPRKCRPAAPISPFISINRRPPYPAK